MNTQVKSGGARGALLRFCSSQAWLLPLLLVVIILLLFSNSLGREFIWDDAALIQQNYLIRDFDNLPQFFTRDFWAFAEGEGKGHDLYRPLVSLSYLIDSRLCGNRPPCYHFTNLLFHILSTILVYFILRGILEKRWSAWLGALLFAIHPIHTEAGIVVNKDVTIRGLGAADTIVQAHDETPDKAPERVFLIEEGATAILERMTIRHGRPSVQDECGGGIMNYGTLTLKNCVVTNNSAIGGGGVDNRRGTLTIVASTISDNVARGDGPPGIECGGGGGVKCSTGMLTIINSTITGNQGGLRSSGLGGGVRTGCGCTAEIINSTISGNKAVDYGGGIAAAGTVQVTNCTISNNAVGGGGGALWVRGEVNIRNTIIANNIGGRNCTIGGEGGHVGTGSIGANNNNLIEDGSCNADLSGDPMLDSLADNGGDTWTHALLPGSPALDAILAISCTLPTDQRGAPRPVVQTSSDTPCDIGAFELQTD